MRTLLFFLALSIATAQTAKVEAAEGANEEYESYRTTFSSVLSTPTQRELGGVTPTGKFYLIVLGKDGKRTEKPCSRRALIKLIERSSMDTPSKMLALRVLGKPAGIQIYVPQEKKP